MAGESSTGAIERRNDGELIISLSGELDAFSAPQIHTHFQLLALDDPTLESVTLDLRSLHFLDSSGITALVELHRRTDIYRLGFRIVNVHDAQHRVLEIAGLLDYLGVDDE